MSHVSDILMSNKAPDSRLHYSPPTTNPRGNKMKKQEQESCIMILVTMYVMIRCIMT